MLIIGSADYILIEQCKEFPELVLGHNSLCLCSVHQVPLSCLIMYS